ncbi:MAG: FRG domain-containing protein [Actinomycetaceae bacterium]|nr:FRG domain-containing protein [Actinomycetaceae bacterium]
MTDDVSLRFEQELQVVQRGDDHTLDEEVSRFLRSAVELLVAPDYVTVFRGQADRSWDPLPTLYRRLLNGGFDRQAITEELVVSHENDLFCEANGIGVYAGSRLKTMVRMQHHGGATRLLDVTRDLFVALWFAVGEEFDAQDGELICYRADPRIVALDGEISTWDQITCDIPPGSAMVYFPRFEDESRIVAQASGFIVSRLSKSLEDGSALIEGTDFLNRECLTIPSGLKAPLRRFLRQSRGMRSYTVFPDFAGFAAGNAVGRHFSRAPEELYDGSKGIFPSSFRYPA